MQIDASQPPCMVEIIESAVRYIVTPAVLVWEKIYM